jgi:hypothetical protein
LKREVPYYLSSEYNNSPIFKMIWEYNKVERELAAEDNDNGDGLGGGGNRSGVIGKATNIRRLGGD